MYRLTSTISRQRSRAQVGRMLYGDSHSHVRPRPPDDRSLRSKMGADHLTFDHRRFVKNVGNGCLVVCGALRDLTIEIDPGNSETASHSDIGFPFFPFVDDAFCVPAQR
jgi:hypothetical protein